MIRPATPRSQRARQTSGAWAAPSAAGFADAVERTEIGQGARQALLHQCLVVGEGEIHVGVVLQLASFGSRGMPRPRSEMMFF